VVGAEEKMGFKAGTHSHHHSGPFLERGTPVTWCAPCGEQVVGTEEKIGFKAETQQLLDIVPHSLFLHYSRA